VLLHPTKYNTEEFRLPLLHDVNCAIQDETKALIRSLKKTTAGRKFGPSPWHGDIHSILLNERRRYLVQDGSSISKGVDVLIGVSNDINSVFLHLLENPRLCDRSAVEIIPSINGMPGRRVHGVSCGESVGKRARD
jgi:hypothetical protein